MSRAGGGAERRANERAAHDGPATVHVAGLGTMRSGRVRNLSANGVLLVLDQGLPLGAEARLRLALEDGEAPLELRALVVRQLAATADGGVPVAFCFIHPPPAALRRLSALIYAPAR